MPVLHPKRDRQVTRPEASSVTSSVWAKVREVKLLEILQVWGPKSFPTRYGNLMMQNSKSFLKWFRQEQQDQLRGSQDADFARFQFNEQSHTGNPYKEVKPTLICKKRNQSGQTSVKVFSNGKEQRLSLSLSQNLQACRGMMHETVTASPPHHNVRQSVQRLHKHMAASKAPRRPRPRDF